MSYIPLNVHSHYSLLLGLSKPENIARRCKEIGTNSCALTDLASIAGAISFFKKMNELSIKPIIGCKFILSDLMDSRITILARNIEGWKTLLSLVSISNGKDRFQKQPKLLLKDLENINNDNIICINGYYDSSVWKLYCDKSNKHDLSAHIKYLKSIFSSLFLEISLFDKNYEDIGLYIRNISKEHNIPALAGIESYYPEVSDSDDQKILICSNMKSTLPETTNRVLSGEEIGYNRFFNNNTYYILDNNQINDLYTTEEIENTKIVASMCEEYSLLKKPTLPKFDIPVEFESDAEYLRHLCRKGWKEKISNVVSKENQNIYTDRVKKELEILQGAGLSSYFLIVADILNFIRKNSWLPGPGRGSAAGCLVSYLIGITSIDPIKYNLLFERFYNSGRNTKDRISMPDIDVDVPINHRDDVIRYIKNKYGEDKVAQMITFTTLKGRGALKEVLRIHDNITFDEMNKITKNIPDEAKIADELQDLKDEDGFASIIMWSLENEPEKLKQWCYLEGKELKGPLAKRFEQAIRIEGIKYHQSKHAAGIAISATSLNGLCPMIYDTKADQNIAGLEMSDLESLGIVKFDILGIALLDKIMHINNTIEMEN